MEELKTDLVTIWTNLKPRKMAGFTSNGMVMCASNAEKTFFELVRPPPGSKVGDRIQYAGNPVGGAPLSEVPEPKINPKKKIEEKFMALLKTNDNCEATYNGVTWVTSEGALRS